MTASQDTPQPFPFAKPRGPTLALASNNMALRALLQSVGVPVTETQVSLFDADAERRSLWASRATAEQSATIIATREAADAGQRSACPLTLGVERILETAEGTWPGPPRTRAEARELLMLLRGKTHHIITAAVLVQDGAPVWESVEVGYVGLRDFDTAFLDAYLDAMGDEVKRHLGGYTLEGLGLQLVTKVFGTMYSMPGLALMRLLEELRARGVLRS